MCMVRITRGGRENWNPGAVYLHAFFFRSFYPRSSGTEKNQRAAKNDLHRRIEISPNKASRFARGDAHPMERLVRRLNFRPGMHTADKISSFPPPSILFFLFPFFTVCFLFFSGSRVLLHSRAAFFCFPNRRYAKQIDRCLAYPIESDSRPCNQNGGCRARDRESETDQLLRKMFSFHFLLFSISPLARFLRRERSNVAAQRPRITR